MSESEGLSDWLRESSRDRLFRVSDYGYGFVCRLDYDKRLAKIVIYYGLSLFLCIKYLVSEFSLIVSMTRKRYLLLFIVSLDLCVTNPVKF